MDNPLKSGAKKSRDKLLSGVVSSLEDKLDALKAQLNNVQDAQLTINHNHLQLLNEIMQRGKNSGTLVLSETEIVTKIFSGLKMYLDPRDMAISIPIALDSIWEHQVTAAWLKVVEPHDTVFEVGSNNGYYGALAAQKTDKKKSKVVLFEANPNLIPYIRKTIAANWLNEQSTVEQLAVADQDGELELHILKDYIGSSSLHSPEQLGTYLQNKMHLEAQQVVKVPATTIDNYCAKHDIQSVDLMIMDIEGFEDKAYKGMRGIVKNSPRLTFFIEFTKQGYENPKAFYDQMLDDFGNVYTINDDGQIVKPKSTDYESIIGDTDDWVMPIFSKRTDLAG